MIVKRRHQHFAQCDGCGAELPPEYDYFDAVAAMKREGWAFVRGQNANNPTWYNFCPTCRARREPHD